MFITVTLGGCLFRMEWSVQIKYGYFLLFVVDHDQVWAVSSRKDTERYCSGIVGQVDQH